MDFKTHLEKLLSKEDINKLLNSIEKERSNFLVLNTFKMSIEDFKALFPKVVQHEIIPNGFYYDPKIYDFGKSFYFDNGLFYILDSASALVSYLLDVKDNENVLDICAAPGGKSISLSFKNRNINLISNDISYQRALILSSNVERMGLANIIVTSDLIDDFLQYKGYFDKILLDAPCSGSAMFRKSEEMVKDWTYNKVLSCQQTQKELLKKASLLIKEGGVISYSTCSFSYEEDEEVILDFLNKHQDFELINLPQNKSYYRSHDLPEAIHIFPYLYKGEGQFICQLKKKGNLIKERNTNKINDYGFFFKEKINDKLFVFNHDIKLKNINVIRKGLHVLDYEKNREIPSFHYAHYLNCNDSIELNEDEYKKYIHGDEIIKKTTYTSGYHVVSYNKINLGYVHIVGDKLKNHYPKGLRH